MIAITEFFSNNNNYIYRFCLDGRKRYPTKRDITKSQAYKIIKRKNTISA